MASRFAEYIEAGLASFKQIPRCGSLDCGQALSHDRVDLQSTLLSDQKSLKKVIADLAPHFACNGWFEQGRWNKKVMMFENTRGTCKGRNVR